MNKFKNIMIVIIIMILFVILINPPLYIKAAYDGMLIFAINIIPTLFPFMFLGKLLSLLLCKGYSFDKSGKVYSKMFYVPKSSIDIFLLSLISGYPIGAKMISERNYDKNSSYKLCALCSNAGIIFIVGTIGSSIIHNTTAGIIIYIANIISCIISCLIMNLKYKTNNTQPISLPNVQENANILYSSITNSILSIFIVGGYVIIFSVLSTAFLQLKLLYPIFYLLSKFGIPVFVSEAYFVGLIEFSKGCILLSKLGLSQSTLTVLCSSLTAFGGICVMLQSLTYLKNSNIKTGFFIYTKIIHLFFSVLICSFLAYLFL